MRLREGVRALILDPDDHVLLVRFWWPGIEPSQGFWANPGGGVETGETRLAALQRELLEETGLQIDALGPEVWTKTAIFAMPGFDGQVDHIHLFRTPRFEPAPAMSPDELMAESVHEVRWWSVGELGQAGAAFAPRMLPDLLSDLLRRGVPESPVEIEGF
jgi:8-oxo-dGTP pyrophosphatase MutT (NUDIX family)